MKTFCIYYPSVYEGTNKEFTAEYWLNAQSESVAMDMFKKAAESVSGNQIDFPCTDMSRVKIEEA